MSKVLPEYNTNNFPRNRVICLFCEKQKINNRSKNLKSLDSLFRHIVQCPSAEYEPEKIAYLKKLVIKAKTEPESYLKLMKIGVILP